MAKMSIDGIENVTFVSITHERQPYKTEAPKDFFKRKVIGTKAGKLQISWYSLNPGDGSYELITAKYLTDKLESEFNINTEPLLHIAPPIGQEANLKGL